MTAEPASDDAREARHLVRTGGGAVLSTLAAADGWPFASLVLTACSQAGEPLMLLSDLAEHTRNLRSDARATLLFARSTAAADLAAARVAVSGRVVVEPAPEARSRYLARNPSASDYAAFRDFRLCRMAVERAHLVAGFGRIRPLARSDLIVAAPPELAAAEAGIVAHMNEDHADALALYATGLLRLPHGNWRMTGIDPEGIDIADGPRTGRLDFPAPIDGPAAARTALVRLAAAAREASLSDAGVACRPAEPETTPRRSP
ncbi:MAG: HugZ family protein [Alphaproteobacteria bacterium]